MNIAQQIRSKDEAMILEVAKIEANGKATLIGISNPISLLYLCYKEEAITQDIELIDRM